MERKHIPEPESKLTILYALRGLGPVTDTELLQFLAELDLMNYFTMQLNLCDMEEQGQLRTLPHPAGNLLEPTAGEVRLFGQPVDRRSRAALLRRVGFMPGEAVFHSGLRVREILKLSADLRGVDCTAEADALCQRLQLAAHQSV